MIPLSLSVFILPTTVSMTVSLMSSYGIRKISDVAVQVNGKRYTDVTALKLPVFICESVLSSSTDR